MKSEDFKRMMATFTDMMLTQEHEPESQFSDYVHILTEWMMESFNMGASGSGTPHVIEKLRTMNNPLATATANAMQWSYGEGQKAR